MCRDPRFMRRHILLSGPPGCGKSMIMRKVAESQSGYVKCSLSRTEGWLEAVGLIAKVLRRCSRGMLLFLDEVDELGLSRDRNGQSVYELLRLMDGVEDAGNLVIVASTNRIGDLDPALLRPGRFGPVMEVSFPDSRQLRVIVEYYASRYGFSVDSGRVAGCVGGGVTGADVRLAVEGCLIDGLEVCEENVIHRLRGLARREEE